MKADRRPVSGSTCRLKGMVVEVMGRGARRVARFSEPRAHSRMGGLPLEERMRAT